MHRDIMSGAATVTTHTASIAGSSAMILSMMASYKPRERVPGVEKGDGDEDDGDGGSPSGRGRGGKSSGELEAEEAEAEEDKKNQRWPSAKVTNSFKIQSAIASTTGSQHHQAKTRLSKGDCGQTRQNFDNQTSAIRRMNSGSHSSATSTTSSSSGGGAAAGGSGSGSVSSMSSQQSQYQFQYQEEFNKMRERLFRLLSKVPIQVETGNYTTTTSFQSQQEVNCRGGSGGPPPINQNSNQQAVCSREPLIIKYYNERYLAEILDLHFSCSLKRHNYERQMASDDLLPPTSKVVNSPTCDQARSSTIQQYICPNQLKLVEAHSLTGPTTTVHNLANDQQVFGYQQQHQDHRHQQSTYADWQQLHQQQPTTIVPQASSFGNFQWQSCGNLESKPRLSCAADAMSRLGASSCSNSSSSSHNRGSSASIVMKDINQQHHSAKKPLLCNGNAAVKSVATRQRRPAKLATATRPAGGGSHGSQDTSSPPTTNTTTSSASSGVTSPIVSISNNRIYRQPHLNGKQTKCYLMGAESEPSPGSAPYTIGGTFASNQQQQQLAIGTATTFNSGILDADSSNYNNHNHHQHQQQQQQQTDQNQNIHLHLYAHQTQAPYHSQQQLPLVDQSPNGISQTTMDASSQAPPITTHFNLQPTIEQYPAAGASIMPPFRPHLHYHSQVAHDHRNGHQQLVYDPVDMNGSISLEQAQLLQQQQHQNHPMTSIHHLAQEQPAAGVQYYTTINHPQLSGANYHHLQPEPCDSANNWRSQLCQIEQIDERPHQQQMIEQQQQQQQQQQATNGILSDNYGRDRGFHMAPGACTGSNYSMLYANGRQQAGVIELQLDMTLNGAQ